MVVVRPFDALRLAPDAGNNLHHTFAGGRGVADGGNTVEDLRRARPRSRIASERLRPGPASTAFLALTTLMAGATVAFLVALPDPTGATAAEEAAAGDATILAFLHLVLPIETVRVLAAVGVGASVFATGLIGRRLLHNDATAVLAAWIVAFDPALAATGHLAVPHAFVLGLCVGALALWLHPSHGVHWAASGLFAVACLFDPAALVWGLPLLLLVLIRGHIYAAPVHLGIAFVQTVGLPALAALLVAAARATTGAAASECLRLSWLDGFAVRRYQDLGGVIALPNAALHAAGLAALFAMAAAVGVFVVRGFRLARLPGRVMLRLPAPLRSFQARILWLALLALIVPHPLAWVVLAALGLAAGVGELAEDAPGFGLAVGLVAAAFATLWLVRSIGLVTGGADAENIQEVLSIVPWAEAHTC